MPQITIRDVTASAQLDVAGGGFIGKQELAQLTAAASDVISALSKPVSDPSFHRAKFAAVFRNPSIAIGAGALGIKEKINTTLAVFRASDTPLFGPDDYDPVEIGAEECWVYLGLEALAAVNASVPLSDGFGVSFGASVAPAFGTYVRIPSSTTLKDALSRALSAFEIPAASESVLAFPPDTVHTVDVTGSVTAGGTWSLPLGVNQLSLADASLPFHANVAVSPSVVLNLEGNIEISGSFQVRFRRAAANRLRVGLYKSQGVTLEASFTAAAAIDASLNTTDLITRFFEVVDPKIDLHGLSPDDAGKIRQVLNDSIDRSLSISLNAACSAAVSEEAALVYEIDVSSPDASLRHAIDRALQGDWTLLTALPNARRLRNVITDTTEKTTSLTVNLLGLYNYRSVADFVAQMKVIKNDEDGSITITDTATASRIATASTPLAADGDRLRAALYVGFVATATYKALAAGLGASPAFTAAQDFLLYKSSMDYRQALKQLNAGLALGVLPADTKAKLPPAGPPVHHARFAASCVYGNDDVLRFFFSDIRALTPRTAADLKQTGRRVLASLLDPQDSTDQKRIFALQSDSAWAEMDANPARVQPPYYSDWMDITEWAETLAKVGPLLTAAVQAGKAAPGDPTADPGFMQKRAALAHALEETTRKTHAAFERAFPICVMATLGSLAQHSRIFQASWNGITIFSNAAAATGTATRDA